MIHGGVSKSWRRVLYFSIVLALLSLSQRRIHGVFVSKRTYRQFCGVARALDLVGERWTLLLIRNLLMGPRRYGDLLEENPGITTNLLAERLVALHDAGLVEKIVDDEGIVRYALTDLGRALDPVVQELGRFGQRFLRTPGRGERADLLWAFSSIRRRYTGGLRDWRVAVVARDDDDGDARTARAKPPARTRRFTFTDIDYAPKNARKADAPDHTSPLRVTDSLRAGDAHVVATAATPTWFRWLRSDADAADLERAGLLVVDGDRGAWAAFLGSIAPFSPASD
jgi:DNA-binding HxlR family transcriptional regulator